MEGFTGDDRQLSAAVCVQLDARCHQGCGVRVSRTVEDGSRLPDFRDKAAIQNTNAISDGGRDGKVVGDQQDRAAELVTHVPEEGKHLRLHSHVQSRRGLIGDHKLRFASQRNCEHDSLSQSTRELMWKVAQPPLGVRDSHGPEQVEHLLAAVSYLLDLRTNSHRWIERGHRVLKHRSEGTTAQFASCRLIGSGHVHVVDGDGAFNMRGLGQQAQYGKTEHRLAGPRLPNQADDLPRFNPQVDSPQSVQVAPSTSEGNRQARDVRHRRRWRGGHVP